MKTTLSTREISKLLIQPGNRISIKDLKPEENFHVGSPEPQLPPEFTKHLLSQENAERIKSNSKKVKPSR